MASDSMCSRAGRCARGPLAALAMAGALLVAGCAPGTSKAGGAPVRVAHGTVTLTFASADPLAVDTTFVTKVNHDSDGHLRLRTLFLDARSPDIDQTIAGDIRSREIDVGDVGSRAWESLGLPAFSAYQAPFLVTSREVLDESSTGIVATSLLGTLRSVGITGLAIVPDSIRYLYSTRPLTTLAQFSGAKIRINASATSSEVISALGATPVTNVASGPDALQALRDGSLTAIESNPQNAIENGYVTAAPYVVANVPLFAKTDTFAVNSAVLAALPAADASALRLAARQAAATQDSSATDRTRWALACGEGLRPLALTERQFLALHNAEGPTYAALAADAQTTLAIDRIGALAVTEPRMDSWATCHGIGVSASSTGLLDGSYTDEVTQADVVASGDCTDCGNAGSFRLVVSDGRYALYHPVQINASPDERSVVFFAGWRPADPVEVGIIWIAGNRVTQVPEVNQQNASGPATYTFELFRGTFSLHLISGQADLDTSRPWQKQR
jgi:TRAP-type C4-dicarboxylate transport system substrate-binding protein